jgi:ribonuclease R
MQNPVHNHRKILRSIAERVMAERGFLPFFSKAILKELDRLTGPAPTHETSLRDLRDLPWCSIDNDDSLDLDQLTVAMEMPGGMTRVLIAIADVDALVRSGTAVDEHARHNTTSIYTAGEIFPMLPDKLSTDLTSLADHAERLAIVIDMQVDPTGSVENSDIYPAQVFNHAKLAYDSVAAWLEGEAQPPQPVSVVPGLAENLKLQDRTAQAMRKYRQVQGALSLQTIETRPIFHGEMIDSLEEETRNRAKDIIEDFMIAANGSTVRKLMELHFPSIRRVVRTPKRWDRIVELAGEHGDSLPPVPDAKALEVFLVKQKTADPLRFPDLSLAVIKLLGSGEYVAELPDESTPGHFGLAVMDYTHSTAPNRRYMDLITQRLLKAALIGKPAPYSIDEMRTLASHCTQAEDESNKVERQVAKSAAALMLETRIGTEYEAVVTGASPKGTWVRLIKPPVEGMLEQGYQGLDVGHLLKVKLISVDVERGFIDFERI